MLVVTACHRPAERAAEGELTVEVHCLKPERRALDETLSLRGHVEPPPGGDLPLASQVPGRIVSVVVREGDHVTSGQVIATVDDVAAKDAVRQAEANVGRANAAVANAEATLRRTNELVSGGIATKQQLDDAVTKAETEKQAARAAQASLELAGRTLGRVQVRAAFGGVVTRLWRGPGGIVDGTEATPIVELAAATGAEFVADATERELVDVQPGQLAQVTLNAAKKRLKGVVRTVSQALDPTTGLGFVRLTLDAADAPLLIGGHGSAEVVTRHREGVLMLPVRALRGAVSDGAEVVVCDGSKASVRVVTAGYRDEERFEVTGGIAASDEVAVDHVLGLETGTSLVRAR
ncbi:MAG TPA: efflux RND transporter periplasmic adaptor subunit [Polyangiaceae bacterium]